MNENFNWDSLYEKVNTAAEENKRKNFSVFMNSLNDNLVKDLNNAYISGDMDKYVQLKENIKKQGIRVFRNGAGEHKLEFC